MNGSITTLIENSGSEHRSIKTEHGLSFYIQTPETSLIFDCSATENLLYNATKLNIDLNKAKLVVCSHSHYDHSGGYPDVVRSTGVRRLITGQEFFEPKYAYDGKKYTYLGAGFGREFLEKYNVVHQTCGDLMQISGDCWLIGSFNRTHEIETIPKRFVRKTPEGFVFDDFPDEICLAIRSGEGLAVILGCSHPGILNILETVIQRLGKPIFSVWGGSHLMEADDKRIIYTIAEMKKMGVRRMGFSHCSGEEVISHCSEDPELICGGLSTGDSVEI